MARARARQAIAELDRARLPWVPNLTSGPAVFYYEGINQNRQGEFLSAARRDFALTGGLTARVTSGTPSTRPWSPAGPRGPFDALEPLTAVQTLNRTRVEYLRQVVEFKPLPIPALRGHRPAGVGRAGRADLAAGGSPRHPGERAHGSAKARTGPAVKP